MKKPLVTIVFAVLLTASADAQQRHGDGVDDVLQHVPMATVLTMKLCGAQSATAPWGQLLFTAAASYTLAAATTYSLKELCREQRPDHSDRRSMPSGHATFAFAGATMLSHEYGHLSPWVTAAGYGVATLTAVSRVARDRHYLHDVAAGAAIGIAATELSYFLKKKLFKQRNVDLCFNGQQLSLAVSW